MTFEDKQQHRGYHVVYRPGETNRCPGCCGSNWWIGRVMAECAFCGTALDLPETRRGNGLITLHIKRFAV